MGRRRKHSKPNTSTVKVSEMITHSIKKHTEPVYSHQQHSSFAMKNWTEEEYLKYIETLQIMGYKINTKMLFKWGGECVILGYKPFNKIGQNMLKVFAPDMIKIRRLADNIEPSVLYNINELRPIKE